MEAYHAFLNELVNRNEGNHSDGSRIRWITYGESRIMEEKRDRIIESFSGEVKWDFKRTKPWINNLSEGCRICGNGDWSCLFISGVCNARCFYCPSPQVSDDLPSTQKMTFQNPEHYAFYLKEFNFRGCSFSGGEPLMTFNRMMDYLRAIRRIASPDIYIWMYTNGILADREKFKLLADAGLNEVRFDIGAVGYSLDAIKQACGIIPVITIEIPAVPEKVTLLKDLIPEMIHLGVSNLNLHQLRLTRFNADRMGKKNYTYLHGEHPTVVESELAALELIKYADKHSLGLGINYCGFQYKNRFQKAGYRKKIASRSRPDHILTENGYTATVYGTDSLLPVQKLTMMQIRDQVRKKALHIITQDKLREGINYFRTLIFTFTGSDLSVKSMPGSDPGNSRGRLLPGEIFAYTSAPATYPVIIQPENKEDLRHLLDSDGSDIPVDPDLFRIWKYWFIESGLRPYF